MFMGVDELIGKLIADGLHGVFAIGLLAEKIVDTVESTLQWENRLFFEIDLLLTFHVTIIWATSLNKIVQLFILPLRAGTDTQSAPDLCLLQVKMK